MQNHFIGLHHSSFLSEIFPYDDDGCTKQYNKPRLQINQTDSQKLLRSQTVKQQRALMVPSNVPSPPGSKGIMAAK